jgi:Uma2 family endonuclease
MNAPVVLDPRALEAWPDHTQLPDKDGRPDDYIFNHFHRILLTETIDPVLRQKHPDGQFAIGGNGGIYWRYTDPPLEGCKAPDWFYVPDVPPLLVDGARRRSYVLWRELIPPLVILEFVSGDGTEERDPTPQTGKFWVYERMVRPEYYGIFFPEDGRLEVSQLARRRFRPMTANAHGHFEIPELGVALGVWRGEYKGLTMPWLRWFDPHGHPLPTPQEVAEAALRQADPERQRAERLATRLRELGVEPEA